MGINTQKNGTVHAGMVEKNIRGQDEKLYSKTRERV